MFAPKPLDDRIDRVVMSWRLTRLLDFYLGRAGRYGLVNAEVQVALRDFYSSLESGYELRTRRVGLVFAMGAASTRLDTEDPDIPIWVVGQDVIRVCADAARERLSHAVAAAAGPQVTEATASQALITTDTWDDVRTTFGGPASSRRRRAAARTKPRQPLAVSVEAGPGPSGMPAEGPGQQEAPDAPRAPKAADAPAHGEPAEALQAVEHHPPDKAPDEPIAVDVPPSRAEPPDGEPELDGPDLDVFLGEMKRTRQYGLIGSVVGDRRTVGLDLNGCNTISIFGVQGGGKSYTLGSIIEMALMKLPGLNLLQRPLAAVVFHYHQTQDYPPEFVSMDEPNRDPDEVAELLKLGENRPASRTSSS